MKRILSLSLLLISLNINVSAQIGIGISHTQLFNYPLDISEYSVLDSSSLVIIYNHKYIMSDYSDGNKLMEDQMSLQVGRSVTKFFSENLHILDARRTGDKSRRVQLRHDYIGYEVFTYKDEDKFVVTNREYFSADNVYRYEERIPSIEWSLSSDTTTVIGYLCNRAECSFRGREWVVWFSMDIPSSAGPWKLQGLPGVILKAEDSKGEYFFEAIGITVSKEAICMYKWPYSKVSFKQWQKYDNGIHNSPLFFLKRAGVSGFFDISTKKEMDDTWSIPYNPIEY